MNDNAIGFVVFLLLTVALLGLVVWTGSTARLKPHLCLVACTLACLGAAIYFAERLGSDYDLMGTGRIYPVHLFFAKAATGSYLLPLVTGLATLRDRKRRPWHRRAAFLAIGLTLMAAVTGTWMMALARPLGA